MERREIGTNDQQGWKGMVLEMNKMLGEFRKESYSANYKLLVNSLHSVPDISRKVNE